MPSGIPDFRTPMTGLWANVDPMEVAHISVWRRDPARFWSFYGQRFAILDGKQPNGAHRAVAELERRGLVSAVVTQNIDGLHAAAGSDPIEVHGSIRTASCLECGASYSLAETRARGELPRCDCGAVLKPDVVLFGELLPERAILRATALASTTGLLIAIGSSLEVWPVAELPAETLRARRQAGAGDDGSDAVRPPGDDQARRGRRGRDAGGARCAVGPTRRRAAGQAARRAAPARAAGPRRAAAPRHSAA